MGKGVINKLVYPCLCLINPILGNYETSNWLTLFSYRDIEVQICMNSKCQSDKLGIVTTWAAESGIVLIAVLMLVAVLALAGTVSVVTTNTDIKISGNYKTSVQALYAAQAGAEEARTRLRGPSTAANYAGDPAPNPDGSWTAYILTSNAWQTSDDQNYNTNYKNYIPTDVHTNTSIAPNSLQTDISYWVKIRHKREYDAEQAGHTTTSPHYYDNDESTATNSVGEPGNIIYYGYGITTSTTAIQFTTGTTTIYKPVEIITAYGQSGSSLDTIEIEVVHYPGPPIFAPFYSQGGVTINGSSGKFYGTNTCSVNSSLPPIYTNGTVGGGGTPTYTGNPPSPVESGSLYIDIEEYINVMKDNATITITDSNVSNPNYGSSNNYVICYANMPKLTLNGGTGFGILLVDGALELGGNFTWSGLILATGEIKMNGGGTGIIISGAILSGDSSQTDSTNGNVTVKYDSCEIENALNNQPLKVIKWKEDY